MKRYWMLCKAMFLLMTRNRAVLFWNLVFPIFLLVIYRVIFGGMQVGGQAYMAWVVPGVLVFNILAFGLLASGTQMVTLREQGVLNHLRTTPTPPGQLVGSYFLVNVLVCLLQCALILGVGVLVFQMPFTWQGLALALPMVVLGVLSFTAMGQVISGVAATAGVAVAIGQIINFSQMFISDLVMPMQMMPDWIQKIAPYLPAYAVVHLVRPPLVSGHLDPDTLHSLLVVLAYTLLAAFLAVRFFRWAPRN